MKKGEKNQNKQKQIELNSDMKSRENVFHSQSRF